MQYDPELGKKVHAHLLENGLETPALTFSSIVHKEEIAGHVSNILVYLGLNPGDDSIKDTPTRVAKMYCDEIFSGMDYDKFPKCTAVANKMGYDEVVLERGTILRSMCEHHLLPIYGKCHIGYIPTDYVVGISKLSRVASFFAARPQVQERLTEQISAALRFILNTEDVAVVIEADHYCSKLRGVTDHCVDTVTSKLSGRFRSVDALRRELFSLIGMEK